MRIQLIACCMAALLCACSKDAGLEVGTGKSGSITRFAIFQHYMYVLNSNEVQTYDIAQKEHPVLVNRLATDYGLETITLYDNSIFLGSTTALYILDISNPAAPVIQSKSDRLSDIGFSGCDPVVVKGDYVFSTIKIVENVCGVVSSQSALVVYDISDKTFPLVIGTYPLGTPNGLGYKDQYLFVCDEGSDQLLVFDISNPVQVVTTGLSIAMEDPFDLIVDGDRMIVGAKTYFQIFDISDLDHIKKVGKISR
jgi:hypothetical protein